MDKNKKKLINECLMGVRRGDRDSLSALYDLIEPTIRYIALKYLKNEQDALDLEQDFWAEIYKYASKYRYFSNGFGYLCKIMTRLSINRYKKRNGDLRYHAEFVEIEDPVVFEEEAVNKSATVSAVKAALKTLDQTERIIIELTYFEDKTITEIAKEIKISKSQVGRKKLRAIEKMKEFLTKQNLD